MLTVASVNPLTQFKKSRDTQRRNDLVQLKNAIEAYYHDIGYYPQASEIPWGYPWTRNNTTFMLKVPQGPSCEGKGCTEFTYVTDSSKSKPQWYVLFDKKEIVGTSGSDNTRDCALDSLGTACTMPSGYSSSQYLCAYGGDIDCGVLGGQTLSSQSCITSYYACTGAENICNSYANIGNCTFNGGSVMCWCGAPGCVGNACCSGACSR